MRSEKEMMELILGVAKNDKRVRAVYMNGSRANPNITKDAYQDYDIVYVVTETKSFLEDKDWISVFGELTICQEPDKIDSVLGKQVNFNNSYTWLMLFKDGNRIDLHIQTKDTLLEEYTKDRLTVPLLDKDNILPVIPEPSDIDYWIRKPSKPEYSSCCNEFWWCLNNVAKGITRDQLPYAMWMYNSPVREMLHKMIDWYIGINTCFRVSAGYKGKYYKKYLPDDLYNIYVSTYSDGDYSHLWTAVFTACELFRKIALVVAEHFGYIYNCGEDTNMMEYLNQIRSISQMGNG